MNQNEKNWLGLGVATLGGWLVASWLSRRGESHRPRATRPESNPRAGAARYKTPAVEEMCSPMPSFSREPRKKGAHECIFGGPGKTGKCRWLVGTPYHQKMIFSYLEAGRVKKGEVVPILEWLSRHGDHPTIRCRARQELAQYRKTRGGLVRRSKVTHGRAVRERWGR